VTSSKERLLRDLHELDSISGKGPGISRLAFTEQEVGARDWLVHRLEELGAETEIDGMGNVFGWYCPPGAHGLPLVLGSHLDSVPSGGRFDGALGVLCGLEVLRKLQVEGCSLSTPLGVVSFSSEESSRFKVGCLGSQAVSGHLRERDLEQLRDDDGVTLGEAVRSCGFSSNLAETRRSSPWFRLFLEVHIEQGRSLASAGLPLALVRRIAAPIREWIVLTGKQGHSGAQQMSERRDALAAAAELVLAVESIALESAGQDVIATAGALRLQPGSINVISREASLGIDVRGFEKSRIEECVRRIHDSARQICKRRGIDLSTTRLWDGAPAEPSVGALALLEEACRREGVAFGEMQSWAGHDSIYMSHQGPAGLMFVRNPSGVSHQPEEEVLPEDIETVLRVLTAVIRKEAAVPAPPA
jgi:hydantoinase/carbamoylase family amidase